MTERKAGNGGSVVHDQFLRGMLSTFEALQELHEVLSNKPMEDATPHMEAGICNILQDVSTQILEVLEAQTYCCKVVYTLAEIRGRLRDLQDLDETLDDVRMLLKNVIEKK